MEEIRDKLVRKLSSFQKVLISIEKKKAKEWFCELCDKKYNNISYKPVHKKTNKCRRDKEAFYAQISNFRNVFEN